MAAFRRSLGQYPTLGGFCGGILGTAALGGGAWYLGTSAIFVLLMGLLGFCLGAALLLILGGSRGRHEELDAALRDGRGDVEKIRSQVPYNQGHTPDVF
jgi:hypothetical protein